MATQPTSGTFTSRHVAVSAVDGTGTPLSIAMGPGPGDITLDNFEEGNKEIAKVLNRGTFLELVYTDDKEISGSVTVHQVGDLTGHSVLDAVNKTGDFAAGVTKDPGGEVWTMDLIVTMVRGAQTNIFTLSNCRLKAGWKEGKEGNAFTISFVAYKGITVT